jgi:hypothetical protein
VRPRPTLDEIGRKVGTDKSTRGSEPWQWSMGYCPVYDELFTPLRDKPITFLELGWGEWDPELRTHANPNVGGRSAAMWREYFTKAQIHVIDIEGKVNTVKGVELHQGSQDDPVFLAGLHDAAGDFDIVIDDASHISSLTIASFNILWPYVKPGGYYVVEDLFSSYHPWYYDENQADENPDTTRPTAMAFLKGLTDEVNYRGVRSHGPWREEDGEFGWDSFPRAYYRGHAIEWMKFSYNLCIIKKRLEGP